MYLKILKYIVVPITKFISKIKFPWSIKLIKEGDVREVVKTMEIGDVILTIDRTFFVTNFFQKFFSKAEWFHAGIVYDKSKVIEAITTGLQETGIYDFLMTKDYYLLLRPNFASKNQKAKALRWATDKLGTGYDYALDLSNSEELYCSETIYLAYQYALNGQSPFTLRKRFGVMTATPTDIAKANSKFEPLLTNRGNNV